MTEQVDRSINFQDAALVEGFALPLSHQRLLDLTDQMFGEDFKGNQQVFFITDTAKELLTSVRQLPFGDLLVNGQLASGDQHPQPWASIYVYSNEYQQYKKDEASKNGYVEIPGEVFKGRSLSLNFHYRDVDKTEIQSIILENIGSGSGTPQLFGVSVYKDPASDNEGERKQSPQSVIDEAKALAFLDLAQELLEDWQGRQIVKDSDIDVD